MGNLKMTFLHAISIHFCMTIVGESFWVTIWSGKYVGAIPVLILRDTVDLQSALEISSFTE